MKNIDKVLRFKIGKRKVTLSAIIYLSKSDFLIGTPTIVIGTNKDAFDFNLIIFNFLINIEME